MSNDANAAKSKPDQRPWSWYIEESIRSRADHPGDSATEKAGVDNPGSLTKKIGAIIVLAVAISTSPAHAQYVRDGIEGFYGGLGAYGGGLCCGPGGAVIGGAGGTAVGGWVYDTNRSFFSQPALPPRYTPIYPSRQWGIGGSTPTYMRRRY